MASCGYSKLLGNNSISCGASAKNPQFVECLSLSECTADVSQHLKSCKVGTQFGTEEINEQKLLLARAGRSRN